MLSLKRVKSIDAVNSSDPNASPAISSDRVQKNLNKYRETTHVQCVVEGRGGLPHARTFGKAFNLSIHMHYFTASTVAMC